ncbi:MULTISPECIES: class I SAM-dependent methyltransferase [Saccharopolyspora]|uniref:Ubiquinone/menaquinone biosynthesis C-methylase UbiE n=2 Tax=Saccharopolyspora TaxID=1835 RepID=A0A1I6UEM4_9PSEU|nr:MULTISPECIES: class I SAM-dependent methyltransferase [Saccharopolyspora]TWG07612.1 ubiquinone/menaquinone biosynthesis C-methylase UbiE [Saccharopolyspora dendranthemae]SFS99883.1 Ubiquinone/menaquinone biosynthesis C-methylase UbiE [Saccharopolyspora flava]
MKPGEIGTRGPAVTEAFDRAAGSYDRLVAANPGYHRHLRSSARRMCLPGAGSGLRLLDAGCGTGASTAALLEVYPHAEIVGVDASAEMLSRARRKDWPESVRFAHAPIESPAEAGVRGPFDGILAAYLIRNVTDPDARLRALRALLRPGGALGVHEYSVQDSLLARATWQAVCCGVIIPSGFAATGDTALFRYLRRSVAEFDGVGRFRRRLAEAGFTAVRTATMTGWQRRIVHTFVAERPVESGRGRDER